VVIPTDGTHAVVKRNVVISLGIDANSSAVQPTVSLISLGFYTQNL
jgi:hypothetical protein